jgi:hypothetical protein
MGVVSLCAQRRFLPGQFFGSVGGVNVFQRQVPKLGRSWLGGVPFSPVIVTRMRMPPHGETYTRTGQNARTGHLRIASEPVRIAPGYRVRVSHRERTPETAGMRTELGVETTKSARPRAEWGRAP